MVLFHTPNTNTQQFVDKFSWLNSKINAFYVVKFLFMAMLLGRCYVGHERDGAI